MKSDPNLSVPPEGKMTCVTSCNSQKGVDWGRQRGNLEALGYLMVPGREKKRLELLGWLIELPWKGPMRLKLETHFLEEVY